MASTGLFLDIINLFTDLNLATYIGVGVVMGAVGWLFGRVAKAGR